MSKYPELDSYIKQARKDGKTDEQIKQEMLTYGGYNEKDVQEVFNTVSITHTIPHRKLNLIDVLFWLMILVFLYYLPGIFFGLLLSGIGWADSSFSFIAYGYLFLLLSSLYGYNFYRKGKSPFIIIGSELIFYIFIIIVFLQINNLVEIPFFNFSE